MTTDTEEPTPAQAEELVADFLDTLHQWESAYPLRAFPEPDLAKAHELLKSGGMTLDAISASNMRHVVSSLAPRIRDALVNARKSAFRKSAECARAAAREYGLVADYDGEVACECLADAIDSLGVAKA